MTCPHCWTPAAQALAAENAARAAHEVTTARLRRELLAALLAGPTDTELTEDTKTE